MFSAALVACRGDDKPSFTPPAPVPAVLHCYSIDDSPCNRGRNTAAGILTAVVPKIASGLIWPGGGMIGFYRCGVCGCGALGLDYALAKRA